MRSGRYFFVALEGHAIAIVRGKVLERRVSQALATLLTPDAMTNRVDRLVAAGLVPREAEPTDRRGVRVVLTEQGLDLVDRAIEARFDEAHSAVAGLSAKDRTSLEGILHHLCVRLEHEGE